MKSRNTLIFQTNYHTSAFNSFDGDRERHVELPQKKSKIPANRVALVAMGLLQEPKNRPSGAGIDPKRRILAIITAHNSRICGQPGQQVQNTPKKCADYR